MRVAFLEVPDAIPFMFWCAVPDVDSTDARGVSGTNGQVALPFSLKFLTLMTSMLLALARSP